MGRNNYFQFKQFKIIQEKSAMKVGTDGALLGAWADVEGAERILDIGTGTGLIALMLAQRSKAKIWGVEIEKNAAEEAEFNVQESPWNDRVFVVNESFQDFVKGCKSCFDLIVSNPPFFTNSFKNEEKNKAMARHNHLLPFSELVRGARSLLNDSGTLAVVLPNIGGLELIDVAKQNGLFLNRLTKVHPKASKEANRFLMEFSLEQKVLKEDKLIIYTDSSLDYTEMYKELTRDFYLKF
jgi:tRNA1Val (adenine37-N6)-methyltransferase